MKVALPVNGQLLSAVLDYATKVLLVDIEDGRVVRRQEVEFCDTSALFRANRLRELSVDTVICGAVSNSLASMAAYGGIEIIAGVTGSVDQVLTAYINGEILRPKYAMPGFCRRTGGCLREPHRRGTHRGRRRG